MSSPIGVISSDWHCSPLVWADRPQISGDSAYALSQIVDMALELTCSVIASGDLLDQKANLSLIADLLRRQIERLAEGESDLFFVQGQHERQTLPWLSSLHDWPSHLPQSPTGYGLFGGAVLHGIDWTPRLRVADELAKIPNDEYHQQVVLVMHQVCREFMGDVTVPELAFEMLPSNVRLLVVGDYHKTIVKKATTCDGSPVTVVSPGSTHMRAIDEESVKSVFILHDDLSLKQVPLKSRPYCEFTLQTEDDLQRLLDTVGSYLWNIAEYAADEGIPEEICVPLVRVIYPPSLASGYKRLKEAVGDRGHLWTKLLPVTRETTTADEAVVAQAAEQFAASGLIGCLPLAVDEQQEPDAFRVCQRLLTTVPEEARSAEATIAELRQEFGLTV